MNKCEICDACSFYRLYGKILSTVTTIKITKYTKLRNKLVLDWNNTHIIRFMGKFITINLRKGYIYIYNIVPIKKLFKAEDKSPYQQFSIGK